MVSAPLKVSATVVKRSDAMISSSRLLFRERTSVRAHFRYNYMYNMYMDMYMHMCMSCEVAALGVRPASLDDGV